MRDRFAFWLEILSAAGASTKPAGNETMPRGGATSSQIPLRRDLRPSAIWLISTRLPVLGFFVLMFVVFTSVFPAARKWIGRWLGDSGGGTYQAASVPRPAAGGNSVPGKAIFGGSSPSGRLSVGASRTEVIKVLGKPDEERGDVWVYGGTRIYFEGDQVASWSPSGRTQGKRPRNRRADSKRDQSLNPREPRLAERPVSVPAIEEETLAGAGDTQQTVRRP